MADDTQNVPQWFSNFAVKNAEEHGLLAARIEASYGELSTRIETTKGELSARIEATRNDLREEIAANREEIAATRGEIARAETRSTRWTAGIVLGGITVGVGVLSTIIILVN